MCAWRGRMSSDESNDIEVRAYEAALRLLARREHSRRELSQKLSARGWGRAQIRAVLDALVERGYQSDARFAESYVRARVDRGYGPLRIRAELRERGIEEGIVESVLHEYADAWPERLAAVREKRFGGEVPADFHERARQTRFLVQRGFSLEQIRDTLTRSGRE